MSIGKTEYKGQLIIQKRKGIFFRSNILEKPKCPKVFQYVTWNMSLLVIMSLVITSLVLIYIVQGLGDCNLNHERMLHPSLKFTHVSVVEAIGQYLIIITPKLFGVVMKIGE